MNMVLLTYKYIPPKILPNNYGLFLDDTPSFFNCHFGAGSTCGMQQDTSGQLNWNPIPTPSQTESVLGLMGQEDTSLDFQLAT